MLHISCNLPLFQVAEWNPLILKQINKLCCFWYFIAQILVPYHLNLPQPETGLFAQVNLGGHIH